MAKKQTNKKKTTDKKPAPKKFRICIKGRPYNYETVEDFIKACNKYFTSLKWYQKPNISGMCLFLGISRETWHNYKEQRKDFADAIRECEYAIETEWVNRLGASGPAVGPIFYLKNFKPDLYKDRSAGDSEENPLFTKHITGMRVVKDRSQK